jgi:NTP pyrophosphatase (non-canonical NTP hydrolase)
LQALLDIGEYMQSKENEIMDILQEECAEVIQMVSKCRRFGIDNTHLKAGVSNRTRLTEEIGDLQAMIDLCIIFNLVNKEDVDQASDDKIAKLKQWSNIFKGEENVA